MKYLGIYGVIAARVYFTTAAISPIKILENA